MHGEGGQRLSRADKGTSVSEVRVKPNNKNDLEGRRVNH